jgi:uncharacterized membrane protein
VTDRHAYQEIGATGLGQPVRDSSIRAVRSARRLIDSRNRSCHNGRFERRQYKVKEFAMFGLTNLGVIHTAISLVAVGAGIVCFLRFGGISPRIAVGRVYIVMTVLTCLTGFPIFQHGGFGKPHILGIVTLVVLLLAVIAGRTKLFGSKSAQVETVSYSSTFFFHMIPAIAEGATRLPPAQPLFDNPEAPELQLVTGIFFVLFLLGASYQVWKLRSR